MNEQGGSWENGRIESFNATLRDELLDGDIFYTLEEAQGGLLAKQLFLGAYRVGSRAHRFPIHLARPAPAGACSDRCS